MYALSALGSPSDSGVSDACLHHLIKTPADGGQLLLCCRQCRKPFCISSIELTSASMNALVHSFFAAFRLSASGHTWRHAGKFACSAMKTFLIISMSCAVMLRIGSGRLA